MEWFSMSKDSAYCLALLQSYKSENISGAWRITYNIESQLKTYKDFYNNFLIYCKDSVLNEEQLFYCRQRGISVEEAVGLIVNGYAREVMNKLPMEFAVEAQKLLTISLEGSVG